jgi:hypothetical protein
LRQVGRRDSFSIGIDLIRPPVAAKDALKPQRHGPGRRGQSPDDVPTVIDKALGRHKRREFELRFLGDAGPKIGVDIHHGENCRRLRKIERNVKAVANVHLEFPYCASRRAKALAII